MSSQHSFNANYRKAREQVREIRRYIRDHLDDRDALKLASLGKQFKLSPFYLQRIFKAVTGVTPRQYVEAQRVQVLKEDLRNNSSVTDAIYSAGYASSSQVYSRIDTQLGMTPGEYRSGGKDVQISYVTSETPLGLMMMAATDRGLCFLEFGDAEEELLKSLAEDFPKADLTPMAGTESEQFTAWMSALGAYLEGERTLSPIPIALHGTEFQLKVWRYLQTIPPGHVRSYSEVAEALGRPAAARAVANACGANRIAIVVPCHRVIRGDGGLGGYRWGLARKRVLLDRERRMATGQLTEAAERQQ